MEVSQIVKQSKEKMEKAVHSLQAELKKVRTGRAQVAMLDSVMVNYYGSPTPLSQVSAISCPDARSFLIAPWEASVLKDIETAIVNSNLGMSPMNDGKVIRLKLPDLTEERRKDLVKQIKKVVEDARIAARLVRRDANEVIKKAQKDKLLGEDESKKLQDEVQKETDSCIKNIDTISDAKEKELLSI